VVRNGETILSTPALYGGTYRFFRDILPRHGITVRYLHPDRLHEVPKLITPSTRLVFLETPTNPTLSIVDVAALVREVRKGQRRTGRRITIIADNTFATSRNKRDEVSWRAFRPYGRCGGRKRKNDSGNPHANEVLRGVC
jgi:cystathionine beta-lyase/cystathionine gamma-synthase